MCRPIPPGAEMFVYYGDSYARELGITPFQGVDQTMKKTSKEKDGVNQQQGQKKKRKKNATANSNNS